MDGQSLVDASSAAWRTKALKLFLQNPVHKNVIFGFYQLTTFSNRACSLVFHGLEGTVCAFLLSHNANTTNNGKILTSQGQT